jgi:chemotaxis protein CheD
MVESLGKLGAYNRDMLGSIVGGASVLRTTSNKQSVGEQNVQVAREVLRSHGIRVRNEDIGATRGRTLTYATDTGELDVKVHSDDGA